MPHRDIVVIGGSAGGISAVNELLGSLSPELEAAICIVVHLTPDGGAHLPGALGRDNDWTIDYAKDRERLLRHRVYVAPPDYHLLLKPGRLHVVRGPRENRFRPAVDPLFRSAAEHYGNRVIGIILSGALDDGTHGLELIKRHGGLAVVQDPGEAVAPSMPLSAIQNVEVDHILRLTDMAARLPALIEESVTKAPTAARTEGGPDVAEGTAHNQYRRDGVLTEFTCPECGGSLRELEGRNVLRFRCHVGHGYTADNLLADQSDGLENVFWSALRALEEHSMLRRRMSQFAEESGRRGDAKLFEREAREIELRASSIRRILHAERSTPTPEQRPASGNGAKRGRRSVRDKVRPGTKTRRVNS